MIERICPQCQHGNPLDNRFCGHCGASLERSPVLTDDQQSAHMVVAQQEDEVTARLKQVGQAVAVGLATLAAEAGMAWLRRKIEHMGQTPPAQQHVVYQQHPVVQNPTLPQTIVQQTHQLPQQPVQNSYYYPTHQPANPNNGMVTIFSQRVVEVWERGVKTKQTVERNVWRRTQG